MKNVLYTIFLSVYFQITIYVKFLKESYKVVNINKEIEALRMKILCVF